ncbi:MFS transporter [Mesoterricola silvestris]|uniref:MFS transporter n=1 Tax=Mesoterricola silvestris TaxID=2927979 RepID=A0AA48KA61_9BACT|nr:MFS transporter [Mesoterricola silvestris]BDU74689.1 MFS transporter [Mesoterricola silvestris]
MTQEEAFHIPRTVRVLLLSVFTMNTCSFMAIPLLALYLQNRLRIPGWQIATILSVNLICGRVFPILGGLIADRTSYGSSMVAGMAFRVLGFTGFAFSTHFFWLVACAALVGLGGAIYDPAVSAIFSIQPEELRRKLFTYFNQALNAGAILGPAVGGLLWRAGRSAPFLLAASVVAILAIMIGREGDLRLRREGGPSMAANLRTVLSDREFIYFLVGMSLFFMVFAQLYYSFPIEFFRRGHSESMAASIFVLNGTIGLTAMFVLRGVMERHAPLALVRWGALLVAAGMAMVPLGASLPWMLFCVALFSLGETLVLPASDMHIAETAWVHAKGTYFGAFEISMAMGGTLGNFAGTALMANSSRTYLPWSVYAGLGLLLAVVLSWLIHRQRAGKACVGRPGLSPLES